MERLVAVLTRDLEAIAHEEVIGFWDHFTRPDDPTHELLAGSDHYVRLEASGTNHDGKVVEQKS